MAATSAGDPSPLTGGSAVVTISGPSLSSISCSPSTVAVGGSATCTVTLTGAAPQATTVNLGWTTTATGAAFAVPASVTVAAGAASAQFVVTAQPAAADATATITATLGGVSKTATVGVSVPPSLLSLACAPPAVSVGGAATCTVSLSKAAPAGGTVVTVTKTATAGAAFAAPASVTVAAGAASAQFVVTAQSAAVDATATITATLGGVSKTATVRVSVATSACAFSVSGLPPSIPDAGATVTLSISVAGTTCAWKAESTASWAQVQVPGGTGPGSVLVRVFPNFSTRERRAALTIAGQMLTIVQSGSTGSGVERFVRFLFHSFLGRSPSPAELAAQVDVLTRGGDPVHMVVGFAQSPEFNLSGRFIAGLYVGLLNRDAEYTGWLFQRDALSRGLTTPTTLVTGFLGSLEYRLKFGEPSEAAFVTLLYRYVLLREPSPAEVAFQVQALPAMGRTVMATAFLNSPEFREGTGNRLTTFLLFACLLQRDPQPAEMAAWMARFQSGMTLPDAIREILATGEFNAALN